MRRLSARRTGLCRRQSIPCGAARFADNRKSDDAARRFPKNMAVIGFLLFWFSSKNSTSMERAVITNVRMIAPIIVNAPQGAPSFCFMHVLGIRRSALASFSLLVCFRVANRVCSLVLNCQNSYSQPAKQCGCAQQNATDNMAFATGIQ